MRCGQMHLPAHMVSWYNACLPSKPGAPLILPGSNGLLTLGCEYLSALANLGHSDAKSGGPM